MGVSGRVCDYRDYHLRICEGVWESCLFESEGGQFEGRDECERGEEEGERS